MNRPRIVFLAVLFAAGCIFKSPDPPRVGVGDDDAGGGANNGENNGDNNGGPDAANNGANNGNNNGMGDAGNNGSNNGVADMGGDGGGGDDVGPDELCGNGVVDPNEACDSGIFAGEGACPRSIDQCEPDACDATIIVGHPDMCTAVCQSSPRGCGPTDGCCPANCSADVDEDCGATCGNGMIEGAERCDGDCPAAGDCDDGNACTTDTLAGSAATCDAVCQNVQINACQDDDGCCPAICDGMTDNDCSQTCGNDVVDDGETCDGADCPTAADCDDSDACTADVFSGSAANCTAACANNPITTCKADGCCAPGCTANNDPDCTAMCGNGAVEGSETCDGNCAASCDDGEACTTDTLSGSAATCDVACTYSDKICDAGAADGCCPMGCNANNDPDCGAVCGNMVTEAGETCDGADCPTACDDGNTCTTDALVGAAANCDAACVSTDITMCADGDGCCPQNCSSANDNDCSASCGNSVTEMGETCDGNCPTAQDCLNISICHQLVGSAGQCNAFCSPIAGCTTCQIGGTCSCSASQECEGGKCAASDGQGCTSACNQNAYCANFGGNGWVCNPNSDQCVECLSDNQCETYEKCNAGSNTCYVPATCNLAPDKDAWCEKQVGTGFVCDGSVCKKKCNATADCLGTEYCSGGLCNPSPTCELAKTPETWCRDKGTGDFCDTSEGCVYQCPSGCTNCNGTDGCELATAPNGGTANACLNPVDCVDSCDPNLWCAKSVGESNAACAPSFKNIRGYCSNYKSCNTATDCNYTFEYCYNDGISRTGICRPAPKCAVAWKPEAWCQYFQGKNSCFNGVCQ